MKVRFLAFVVLLFFLAGGVTAAGYWTLKPRAVASASSVSLVGSDPRVLQRTIWSASLNRDMPIEVYLPPGYDSDAYVRYPVLYMLHGLGGDQHTWESEGLFTTATSLIKSGDMPAMIIVTPAGEDGYWMDHAGNGPRFGSYVSKDLVSLIDREYRTIPSGAFRAIGGMSMGGHGALQLALNNPGEFSVVGAHSVALRRKDEAFDFFGDLQYYQAHDPVSLAQKNPSLAKDLTIWIDIGNSDQWLAAANRFHQQLVSENVQHVWTTSAGGHDGAYWQSHTADYLRFYGDSFASQAAFATARY